jgi:hypothetical protein
VRFLFTTLTIICLHTGIVSVTLAQIKKDSTEKKSVTKKAFLEGMKLISTSPEDTITNEKSVDPYLEFTGRIIRNIKIEHIGFEKSIYDSAKKVAKTITKLANVTHTNTREKTIRQHLFVHPNKPLNPQELADNERFIRDKDFILDSRIVVTPIADTDSVDITVITRDVFSKGATAGGSPTAPEFGVFDANVDGRGQRIEFNGILSQDRSPQFGYSLLYRKSSIWGSLTNLDLLFTQLNTGFAFGDEHEYAMQIRLTRPLVSPYSRLAGGGEISNNWSVNVDEKPDSSFLDYSYRVYDGWLGYNIGIKKDMENRNRKFLAVRYANGFFDEQPVQEAFRTTRRYNDIYAYLSELTFYRQNFYKTRYVFGFGRTEDIPYGFTFGVSGGYVNQLRIGRPYGALKFNYGQASKKGNFVQLSADVGGYVRNNEFEDVIVQSGIVYFARVLQINKYKLRNFISTKYSQVINQTVIDWLKIGRNEIPGFRSDSLLASQRLAVHAESILFTPRALLGFRLAPFTAIDMVAVNCVECATNNNLFWGFSAGLRARNENLIFGTMEAKFTFVPEDQYGNSKFVFGFRQNLRVKNSGAFVTAPTLIVYNN